MTLRWLFGAGYDMLTLQRQPHLVLLSRAWYDQNLLRQGFHRERGGDTQLYAATSAFKGAIRSYRYSYIYICYIVVFNAIMAIS